jgi:hypothetical protein
MATSRSFNALCANDVFATQGLARHAQENLAVGAQRLPGHRVKSRPQARLGLAPARVRRAPLREEEACEQP